MIKNDYDMIASIIILMLVFTNLGIHLAKHGTVITRKYNFWIEVISVSIQLALFCWAGMFDSFFV